MVPLVQLYVPPDGMINKDFFKQVFDGQKRLLGMNEVRRVNVPKYDELSVKNLWPTMSQDPEFMQFFPDVFPKGKIADREYFFNVMNTVHEEYTQALIRHANEQRTTAGGQARETQTISLTEDWHARLTALPFISCTYFC